MTDLAKPEDGAVIEGSARLALETCCYSFEMKGF